MALTKITPQMFDTSATAHDLNVDNGTFVVDGSASRVGIGTATPSTLLDVNGTATATTFVGALTGNVTGNVSGTAATVTSAAQTNITSLGTLTGLTMSGNLNLNDDVILRLGTSNEFQIYHTSSGNSIISETGSGDLFIDGNNIYLRKDTASGEAFADFIADGAASLYHNGSKKFETTGSGITVTGTLNGISTTKSASGNRWGILPEVEGNGVMEIGRYLDFHATDGDTSDYGARFDYDGSKMILTSPLNVTGNIQVSGTTVLNSSGVLQSAALSGTYSNPVNFSHSSLELSGHMFFNEFSSGRHYIHFKTAASTNQIDWRIQTNSANNTIHSWTNTLASFATPMSISGNLTVTGTGDFSTQVNVGTNNSHFSENNIRFKSSGDAYIDHNTVARSFIFRTGSSSAMDTTVLTLTSGGQINGANGSAVSPTFAFASDPNTGMYRPASDNLGFVAGGSQKVFLSTTQLNISVTTVPGADNTYDLGSQSARWRNLYTTDLHLSNEGSKNDIDGTSGNWTIQEGETDLYIINNKSGKKYKFALEEID